MFSGVSRGIPSFGDLSWKRPVVAASDPSALWNFPVPVLSPAGAASFGQTLTAGANEAITSAPPFTGLTIIAGDRILCTSDQGVPNSEGIWIVTTVGSAGSKWVLTRATDADIATEFPVGAITIAKQFLLSGGVHSNYGFFVLSDSGTWDIRPNLLDIVTILTSLAVGDGTLSQPLTVNGEVLADKLALNFANGDTKLGRAGAGIAELETTGNNQVRIGTIAPSGQRSIFTSRISGESVIRALFGGDATLVGMELGPGSAARDIRVFRDGTKLLGFGDASTRRAQLSVATGEFTEYGANSPTTYSPTLTNFGTATLTKTGRWWRIGKMIYVRIAISVSAAGAGGGTLGVDLPTSALISTSPTIRAQLIMTYGSMTGLTPNAGVGAAVRLGGSGDGVTLDRLYTYDATAIARANLTAGAFIHIVGWYEEA